MPVRSVVDDEADDEAHVALLDTCEEGIEVGHVAELLHDFAVVAGVVPVICIWGVKMGTQPDNADTKFLKGVELGGDARQVRYPVAIRVLGGTWVDLVDDAFRPPL